MTTNVEVIASALEDLNVLTEGETPSAEQGDYCLKQLNDMMEEWSEVPEIGETLGYFRQSTTTDDCPIPFWAERAVKAKLAESVAPHYGVTISREMAKKISDAFGALMRKCMVEAMQAQNLDDMPMGTGHHAGVSIERG